MTVTRETIAELRKWLSEATPGKWKLWGGEVYADADGTSNLATSVLVCVPTATTNEHGALRVPNAYLIAAMQRALPDLLDVAEAALSGSLEGAKMPEERWDEREPLPYDIKPAMRAVLIEALREAARKADPGDGSMLILETEGKIGNGMWDGGWKLQASFVEDERMHDKPFVVVHAYHDSQVTKGSVSADVVRTPDDRRYLARQRLDAMVQRRNALSVAIDKLTAELAPEPK